MNKIYVAPRMLTNKMTDGSFEVMTTGGNYSAIDTTHVKYGTKSLKLFGTTSAEVALAISTFMNQALVPSHIYYVRVETYQETAVGSMDIYWPIAEPSMLNGQSGPAGQWNLISTVVNRAEFSAGNYPMRLDFNNNGQAGNMWFDGLALIDLTAEFGSGNEPNKEWCDKNISFTPAGQVVVLSGGTSTVRAIKNMYVGVANKARKIAKTYLGVNGRAIRVWGTLTGTPKYVGTLDSLSQPRNLATATKVGRYAIFAGGYSGSTVANTAVDAYDRALVKTSIGTLTTAAGGQRPMGAWNANYALICGGYRSSVYQNAVEVYTKTLTKGTPNTLSQGRSWGASGNVGDYAIVCGGYTGASSSVVDAFNLTLTRSTPQTLSSARRNTASANVGDYFLVAGGFTGSAPVDAYSKSLTRSTPTALHQTQGSRPCGVGMANYAIFAGGSGSGVFSNVVTPYNATLSRGTSTTMATARDSFYGDYVNGFAFLGGGLDAAGANLKAVDIFNDSLARTDGFTLPVGGNTIQAMAIGDFVIFACGWDTAASSVASAFTVI